MRVKENLEWDNCVIYVYKVVFIAFKKRNTKYFEEDMSDARDMIKYMIRNKTREINERWR